MDFILNVISDGPTKSFAFRRLRYLESKFHMYVLFCLVMFSSEKNPTLFVSFCLSVSRIVIFTTYEKSIPTCISRRA